MISLRRLEPNRRNALSSTGPRSEAGKRRSRRNAFRHGWTAETVIEALEDAEDYRAFEAAIIGDYDTRTAVECELVVRLASLWRIRRATSIETGLLISRCVRTPSPRIFDRAAKCVPPLLASTTLGSRRWRSMRSARSDEVHWHGDLLEFERRCRRSPDEQRTKAAPA
jgi:hypothetical protein